MKKLLVYLFLGLAFLLLVGVFQNWLNTPERGCTKIDSAPMYWEYQCKGGREFFEQK